MEMLTAACVKTLIDIRLWRTSRFVPWASGSNLKNILGEKYKYMPELAPTRELLNAYKNGEVDWNEYETIFNNTLSEHQIEKLFTTTSSNFAAHPLANKGECQLYKVCFLCSEKTAEKCHRRLVAEYLQKHFNCEIIHL